MSDDFILDRRYLAALHSRLPGLLYNWTDDLPLCKQSGVGYNTNLVYRPGGGMGAVTDYEDRSFHFSCPGDCFLYGVFDGHDGTNVADFAGQKLPAELLLGQLKDDYNDENVKAQLTEAFESVTKGFVDDMINDPLVEKMNLEASLPVKMSPTEAKKRFPSLFQHLGELEKKIAGGCSVVIALIHKQRLFIANVGDARALFCRVDDGDLGIVQLSTDHTVNSNSELQRLDELGLDIENLQKNRTIRTTRSLGDWALKAGYKTHPILKFAREEPILSTPSVHGGEDVSSSQRFLILMSQGVYNAYEQATGVKKDQVNNNIAMMVHEEIRKQTTIEGVAQSVVDQICRLHHDKFVQSGNQKCMRRDDMTLLVRIFNIEVGKNIPSAIKAQKKLPQLTPLIMPEHRKTPSPQQPGTPNSTDSSSTPKTTTPGSPPGSVGSATASPTWTHPGRSKSPLMPVTQPSETADATPYAQQHYQQQKQQQQRQLPKPQIFPIEQRQTHPQQLLERFNTMNIGERKENTPNPRLPPPKISPPSTEEGTCLPSFVDKSRLFNRPEEPLETDEKGRIKAYVSFDEFTKKIEEAGGENVVFADFLRL